MAERLPVLGLLGEALLVLRQQGYRLLPVGLVSAVLWGLASAAISRVGPEPSQTNASLLMVVLVAVAILTLPLITGAHRLVLQGQRARTGWSLHPEEARFVLALLRLAAPALLGAVVLSGIAVGLYFAFRTLAGQVAPTSPAFLLAAVAVGTLIDLAMSLWLTRFLLVLPAAAVGQSLKLRQSSRLMTGNVWRLFLAFLPLYVIVWVVTTVAGSLGPSLWLVSAAISGVMTPFAAVMGALLLSLAYRRLLLAHEAAVHADRKGGSDQDKTEQERTLP